MIRAPESLGNMITATVIVITIAMVFFYYVKADKLSKTANVTMKVILLIMCLVSIGSYTKFKYYEKTAIWNNNHDIYHYYIGAKYSKELGYFDMYTASVLADMEMGQYFKDCSKKKRGKKASKKHRVTHCKIRYLGGYEKYNEYLKPYKKLKPYDKYSVSKYYYKGKNPYKMLERIKKKEQAGELNKRDIRDKSGLEKKIKELEEIKQRLNFTPESWQEYKKDLLYFQKKIGSKRYKVIRDKGYNATPVWNVTAKMISSIISTDSKFTVGEGKEKVEFSLMGIIPLLDIFLVGLMLFFIWRTFDFKTGLFVFIFFASNFFLNSGHIRGCFLRYDWVVLIVISMCLIKLDYYKTAAVLMAYAGLARIFPIVFAFGMGCCYLWFIYYERKILGKYFNFFIFYFGAMAVFFIISVIDGGGLQPWKDFFEKITVHNRDIVSIRLGFKNIFLGMYENTVGSWNDFGDIKRGIWEQYKMYCHLIQLGVLGVVFIACRRLSPYRAIAISFVPAFFMATPTFYYYVMFVIPFMFFIPEIRRLEGAIGAAIVLGISATGYFIQQVSKSVGLQFTYTMAVIMVLLGIYMIHSHSGKEDSVNQKENTFFKLFGDGWWSVSLSFIVHTFFIQAIYIIIFINISEFSQKAEISLGTFLNNMLFTDNNCVFSNIFCYLNSSCQDCLISYDVFGTFFNALLLTSLLLLVAVAKGVVAWIKEDAESRAEEMPEWFYILSIFLSVPMFAYYCIKTRGFPTGLLQISKALILFIVSMLPLSVFLIDVFLG